MKTFLALFILALVPALFACSNNPPLTPPTVAVAAATVAATSTPLPPTETLFPTATPTATPSTTPTDTPTSVPTETATSQPSYTPAPTNTYSPLTLSIDADFDGACSLSVVDNSAFSSRCEGGKYLATLKVGDYWQWLPQTSSSVFSDTVIQVDALLVPAGGSSDLGIVSRMSYDGKNGYVFITFFDGRYGLLLLKDGSWSHLVNATRSPAIRVNEVNTLKVVTQGKQIALYANGQWLTTVTDSTLSKGYTGVALGTKGPNAKAEFDNYKVWRINSPLSLPATGPAPRASVPPPANAPTPTALAGGTSKYQIPAGKGGLVVRNWYGQEANFTIANTLYKVPPSGEVFIVLDPGTYPWSSNIPGIGIANGTSTIVEGRIVVQQFADR